jgi:protein-disulfide isomerase
MGLAVRAVSGSAANNVMCSLCVALLACILAAFVFAGYLVISQVDRARAGLAITAGLFFLLLGSLGLAADTRMREQATKSSFRAWLSAQPRSALGGNENGSVVRLTKYHDYQCPSCAIADHEDPRRIREISHKLGVEIQLVVKDYPLDSGCNPFVSGRRHPHACYAAALVRLAQRQGRGDQLRTWIFQNQASLSAEVLADAARRIGGVGDPAQGLEEALAGVRDDIQEANRLGVSGTPALVINDLLLPGGVTDSMLEVAIEEELRRMSASATP